MPALALTDQGARYGAIDFHVAASQAGSKPIFGAETYIARNSRFERDPHNKGNDDFFRCELVTRTYRLSDTRRARIDFSGCSCVDTAKNLRPSAERYRKRVHDRTRTRGSRE